jgi:ACS family sodium-dependent inorganic phosphate cotransporter
MCAFSKQSLYFFEQSTILQWREVFWIVFGVFLVSNLLFIFMGSGELQPWNNPLTMKQGTEEAGKSQTSSKTGKSIEDISQ